MRIKFLSISLILLLLSLQLSPALAGTVTVSPNQTGSGHLLSGSAKVNKVGSLFGSDLSVFVDGNVMEVQENKDGTRKTIASGVVFSDKVVSTAKGQKLTGFWYCRSGERQDDVIGRRAESIDVIVTADGARLTGKIAKVNREEIIITTEAGDKPIATREVTRVSSDKVFEFSCILKGVSEFDRKATVNAEVDQFFFKSSYDPKLLQAAEKQINPPDRNRQVKNGWSRRKKILVFAGLALLVATAIAVPIAVAVPLANRRDNEFTPLPQPVPQPQQGQGQQTQN